MYLSSSSPSRPFFALSLSLSCSAPTCQQQLRPSGHLSRLPAVRIDPIVGSTAISGRRLQTARPSPRLDLGPIPSSLRLVPGPPGRPSLFPPSPSHLYYHHYPSVATRSKDAPKAKETKRQSRNKSPLLALRHVSRTLARQPLLLTARGPKVSTNPSVDARSLVPSSDPPHVMTDPGIHISPRTWPSSLRSPLPSLPSPPPSLLHHHVLSPGARSDRGSRRSGVPSGKSHPRIPFGEHVASPWPHEVLIPPWPSVGPHVSVPAIVGRVPVRSDRPALSQSGDCPHYPRVRAVPVPCRAWFCVCSPATDRGRGPSHHHLSQPG